MILKVKNASNVWEGIPIAKGENGSNGVSPTLSSSKTGKTTTIMYTDATHPTPTQLAQILDGEDGQGVGDMLKSVYDTDNDGIVDNSEALDGHPSSYFAKATDIADMASKTWVANGFVVKEDGKGLFSGSYNDLTNKPTIPDVSGKEATSNKVISLTSSSTDTQYPSAKCVYDIIGNVESLLSAI